MKHPDRAHAFPLPTGTAYMLFPEATEDRCTAALLLNLDPAKIAKLRPRRTGYVTYRPYAASSLLAAALARVFGTARRGASKDRPELAATTMPLELSVPALRCRAGTELIERLFGPLGWQVQARPISVDSWYAALTLRGTLRLVDALNHLYVLLPVLDDAKHYWVAPAEIDKLLRAGEGWLAGHPERTLIARRYLAHQRSLAEAALSRLADDTLESDSVDDPDETMMATEEDARLPTAVPLAARRRAAVRAALAEARAATVVDLGCGTGALLAELVDQPGYRGLAGADASPAALERAAARLRDRAELWQTGLTYRDDRLRGFDAAVLMEVVEHIDPPQLPALADAVFGQARPTTVVVTTPNVEYNVRFQVGGMRHPDHRFEWTRAEFSGWTAEVAAAYGYRVTTSGVGEPDPELGCPSQLALFTRRGSGS